MQELNNNLKDWEFSSEKAKNEMLCDNFIIVQTFVCELNNGERKKYFKNDVITWYELQLIKRVVGRNNKKLYPLNTDFIISYETKFYKGVA